MVQLFKSAGHFVNSFQELIIPVSKILIKKNHKNLIS